MKLGYNTNGLAFHRWTDALELLAEVGYESVAITLDHHCLDPFATGLAGEVSRMRTRLERLKLASVIETGARFLLDPRVKHEPTLLSPTTEERARRIDFLKRAIDIASDLGSDAVSFWSGILREPIPPERALERLAAGCAEVIDYASRKNVRLAFEPEPGMFIESFADYRKLLDRVDGTNVGLTIDIGHVQCVETEPIANSLREWSERLFNVHIEDMRRGVHEHLRFGEGEIDFPPVFAALKEIGYQGGLYVELSRHSHMAPEVVRESYDFLRRFVP
ncbi:MAG TPA: sugar phosphate isomerase/epimerase family protein [Planctomycetaceae bacterium]|nr:sugar phosphate isomerase/epimerase family protein [Planctomycetaceae bacterium]